MRLLGEIDARSGAPAVAAAETRYREGLALAEPRGMRPLVAHCRLALGTLFRHAGRRSDSQEHLSAAAMMYREMGMTYWLEKAEAEIGQRV